jgi:RNA polymerase sigma factor (sigma-70 family)
VSLDIEDLYRREYDGLCTYFRKRIDGYDEALAADFASAVFLRAWEHRASYRPIQGVSPRSWLYSIARNLLIDYYRRHHGKVAFVRLGEWNPFGEDAGSDEHIESLHAQITVTRALETYQTGNSHWPPDRHVAVIRERYLEGGTDREVGERLGMTEMVVKQVRKRALANLRKMVEVLDATA